jgi:uncharacterized coiled-coil protein SlyX
MSQYRDDREAARRRIEALEAKLAEREAEMAAQGAAISARDEEIERLQRELTLTGGMGPRHMRSVSAAFASRIVGAASLLALFTAGAGASLVRSSSVTSVPPPRAPFVEAPAAMGPGMSADQVQLEIDTRRMLETKWWAGAATIDDLRLLRAICKHQGDRACIDQVRAALDPPRVP